MDIMVINTKLMPSFVSSLLTQWRRCCSDEHDEEEEDVSLISFTFHSDGFNEKNHCGSSLDLRVKAAQL